jgi:FKBP-type peptidyl-prolyl cis-trans isomerase
LKKFRLLLAVLPFTFVSSCLKDKSCSTKSADSEIPQIQAFAANNGITTTAHSSGLHYQILNQGSGSSATPNSKIVITYTGKLMNGHVFDEELTPNAEAWTLSGLIQGWIIGIPLIQEGGHIKLIVPSSMAYGCSGYGSIPGNTILFFDINLVDVQ